MHSSSDMVLRDASNVALHSTVASMIQRLAGAQPGIRLWWADKQAAPACVHTAWTD